MIDVDVTNGLMKAVDVAKNEVQIELDGWDSGPTGLEIERRVDATLTGETRALSVQDAAVAVELDGGDRWTTFEDETGPVSLPAGNHVVQIGTTIGVYVAFSTACHLSRNPNGTFRMAFEAPAAVTIGFRSHVDRPRESLTVSRTFDGVMTAIGLLSSTIDASTPDKSYPSMRAHPPRIQFGRTAVPDAVRREHSQSDITVAVPPSVGDLLVVAPLIYYLRAVPTTSSASTVRVDAPALPDALNLGTDRSLETDVAALLRRVFFLDCLVRNAGPYGVDLRESQLLDELGLDMDPVYRQSEAERLARYLQADFSAISGRLPDWPLSVVVAPRYRSVRALPYLLARMSLIQLATPVRVARQTVITESVEQSYATPVRHLGTTPTYDLVRNETRLGTRQGWMAEGTPVDAYRATLDAFENRNEYHELSDGPRRVLVVINDDHMLDERSAVERIYRSRSEELTMDVTVVESLSRDELVEAFSSPLEFLHYIGHCDATGLRCRDGTLSTADLADTAVQTFFLNACGSFDQGLELVRRGSVAGAVTLANVLNPEATRVGVTFARLLMHGFNISYALSLASRQSLTNKFYTVVGDGTHRLSQGDDTYPADLTTRRVSPDEFEVVFNFPQLRIPGGLAKPAIAADCTYVLRGCPWTVVLERLAFVDFLQHVNLPVVHENEFYWSTELADRIREPSESAPADISH